MGGEGPGLKITPSPKRARTFPKEGNWGRLFSSAKIADFAKTEKEKYFEDMNTKEDIQRMICFAEDRGH